MADIDQHNPLVQIEQFGPTLPIIEYDDPEQAYGQTPLQYRLSIFGN